MRTAHQKNARATASTRSIDQRRLDQIAKRLMRSPDMGETAAIRAIGIQDPSTIRRLRPKVAKQRMTLAAEVDRKKKKNGQTKTKQKSARPSSSMPSLRANGRTTAPNRIEPTETGNGTGSSGKTEPHLIDTFAVTNTSTPKLPFTTLDPTRLYLLMLEWSPLRLLLWQQALFVETTLKLLRPSHSYRGLER